jgi:zinc transporter 2
MIHIIGDIIQSIGVIIAAILIYVFPKYQMIDPLTTILFSVIVMFTTFPIIKQCTLVIMEGNTYPNDLENIKKDIIEVNINYVIYLNHFRSQVLILLSVSTCIHFRLIRLF